MNLETFIKTQKRTKNIETVKIRLLQSVSELLLNTTNDNLKKSVRQIAILSKTFNVPLSKVAKVKSNNLKKELLHKLSEVIKNENGFSVTLSELLKLIIAYAKSKFLEVEF